MRTRCSGNKAMVPLFALMLCIAGCSEPAKFASDAAAPATAPSPAQTSAIISLDIDGTPLRVPVTLDPTMVDAAGDHDTRVLASKNGIAIVLDSYASRSQSMSRCQAGEERWLRVIDVAAARERYARLVESCLKDVVPGDPLFTGPDASGAYTVNLVSEPSLRIAADGTVGKAQ